MNNTFNNQQQTARNFRYFADYDAPLSEAGEYTQKYHLLRDLFSQFNSKTNNKYSADVAGAPYSYISDSIPTLGGEELPDPPVLQPKEAYEPATMYQHLSLWDALSFTEGVCL